MKKAFTLIELIFVIVIIGILSVVIMSRTGSSKVAEAATEFQSHIRYTQHLAMVDDKFAVTDSSWYTNRWHMLFNGDSYSVLSNGVFAKDAMNNEKNIDNIDLNTKYGVSIALSGGCLNQTVISFDNVGRPMVGNINNDTQAYMDGHMLESLCVITLSSPGQDDINVSIMQETGYVQVR